MDRSREERGSAPPRGEPSVRQTHASHTAKGSKPGGEKRGGTSEAEKDRGEKEKEKDGGGEGWRGPVGDKAIKRSGGERERETKREAGLGGRGRGKRRGWSCDERRRATARGRSGVAHGV